MYMYTVKQQQQQSNIAILFDIYIIQTVLNSIWLSPIFDVLPKHYDWIASLSNHGLL